MAFNLTLSSFARNARPSRFLSAEKIVLHLLALAVLFATAPGQTTAPINKTNSQNAAQCAGANLPNNRKIVFLQRNLLNGEESQIVISSAENISNYRKYQSASRFYLTIPNAIVYDSSLKNNFPNITIEQNDAGVVLSTATLAAAPKIESRLDGLQLILRLKNLQSENRPEAGAAKNIQTRPQSNKTDPSHKPFSPIVKQLFGDNFIRNLKELRALTDAIYRRKDDASKSELLRARAALLAATGEMFLARADLQVALGLPGLTTQERVLVRLQLGDLYRATGRPTAAIEMFEAVLADEPENQIALLARGELALASGDETAAQAAATKLLARSPGDAKAKLLLAETQFATGSSANAQKLLQEVKNDANARADLRALATVRIAESVAGKGGFSTAATFAREAASLSPTMAERSAKLLETIREAESLQNQIKEISGRCQTFPAELSVRAARFNDFWIERSAKPQFSSEAVNVSGFSQTARIAFPGRIGGLNYYSVDEKRPLEIEVEGPTILRLTSRPVHTQLNAPISLQLSVREDGTEKQKFNIERNTASSEGAFADLQGIFPGAAEQFELRVPSGIHRYQITTGGGTVFMRAAAMKPSEFDFLVGGVSSMSWWARAFTEYERSGERSSVAAIESRYRLLGDATGARAALNQIVGSGRDYHWQLFAAELNNAFGENPAPRLIAAASSAPYERLAKNAFVSAIAHYKNAGAIDPALSAAAHWLNAHPEDAEIRAQVAALKLAKGEDFAVEAWVDAELARPFAEAEKIAVRAQRESRWERRSTAASSAGSDSLTLFRAESSSQFRAVREALLAPVFEPGTAQIVSQSQNARIQTDVSQSVNLRAKIYVENFTPVDALTAERQAQSQLPAPVQPIFASMEVTLDGQKVNTINVPYNTLTEIPLPAIPPGENLLLIGFSEEKSVAGQPEQTRYAQVRIENAATGQAIMPRARATQLVATATEPVLLNAFAPGVLRIGLRSVARQNGSSESGAVITITPKSGGQAKIFPVQFPKTSTQSALAYDPKAIVSDAGEMLVILPASSEVYNIEVRPASGQILVNPYDARGEKQVVVQESSAAPGVTIASVNDYLKPSTVVAAPPLPNIDYQILNDQKAASARFGLFTFYSRFDNERTITFEEGERVSDARSYIEQGVVHRKAFPGLRLYTRTVFGERTLFPAIPVFRFENETSQNQVRFGIDWNARFRIFAQPTEGGAASFRFDGSVGRPFRFRSRFLTVTPSIGYFRVWQTLNGNDSRDTDRVSRDVYLRFNETHPQGLFLQSSFTYVPFTDTLFSGSVRATTNRSLSLTDFDRLRVRGRFAHLLMQGRLEISGSLAHTVRFADQNRVRTEQSNQIEGRAEYGWWTLGGRRVELGGGLRWATEYNRPDAFLEFRMDINRSDGFTQFNPSDVSFRELRLRTLNQTPAIRRVEQ